MACVVHQRDCTIWSHLVPAVHMERRSHGTGKAHGHRYLGSELEHSNIGTATGHNGLDSCDRGRCCLRRILRRLSFSEGYEVVIVPDVVGGLEMIRQRVPAVHNLLRLLSQIAICQSLAFLEW